MIRIEETDEEKGHVVLPRYSSEATQIRHSNYIVVAVLRIADLQFLEVCLVVHIPAKYDRAEAEPIFCDSQELLLGHEFAAEAPIDVNAGDFDLGIIFQKMLQRVVRHLDVSLAVSHLDVEVRYSVLGGEISTARISETK